MQEGVGGPAQADGTGTLDTDAVLAEIGKLGGLTPLVAPATFSKDAMGPGFGGIMWNPGVHGAYVYFDDRFGQEPDGAGRIIIYVATADGSAEIAAESAPHVDDDASTIAAWIVSVAEVALLGVQAGAHQTGR